MRKRYVLSIWLSPLLAGFAGADPVVISDDNEAEISQFSEEELLQRVFGENRQQKDVAMEFMVKLDGEEVGRAFAVAGKEEKIFAKHLKDILSRYLRKDDLKQIDDMVDSQGFVSFQKLGFLDFHTKFNLETLDIEISIPVEKKKTRSLSDRQHETIRTTVKPAAISGTVGMRVSQTMDHDKQLGTKNRTNVLLSPAVNFGGVVLEGEGNFENGSDRTRFHRNYSSVVYDFPHDKMTIRGGDVFSLSQGKYFVPRLLGIGFRKEAESSSANNCNANLQITVLRESKLEVYVNGTLVRTKEHVSPGTYYLDDIPYSHGSNDVKIKLTDMTGKTEIVDASGFLDSSIIAPGDFSLDFSAGHPERISDRNGDGRYNKHDTTVSGGIRYGLPRATDVLVGGVRSSSGHTGTVELRNSNLLGFFDGQYGFSKYGKDNLKGNVYNISYSSPSINLSDTMSISFGTTYESTSDYFHAYWSDDNNISDVDRLSMVNSELYPRFGINGSEFYASQRGNRLGKSINNTYRVYFNGLLGLNCSFNYDIRRDPQDEKRKKKSFSVSKSVSLDSDIFRSLNIYLSCDRLTYNKGKSGNCFSTSCSLSMKDNDIISTGYNKDDDFKRGYVSYSGSCLDNALYYTLQGDHQSGSNNLSGNATYYAQVLKMDASHSRGRDSSHSTQLGFETNLYFADGHLGFSQDAVNDGGFVIVSSDGELKGRPIKIENSKVEAGDIFGGVITTAHHSVSSNTIDVRGMPDNIEIKDTSIVSYGEYKRGAVKTVSVDGTYLASGILLDVNGKPFAMAAGYAVHIRDKDVEPVVFFTNASGKFVLSNLKEGRYRVSVNVEGYEDFFIDITPNKKHIINLGTIKIKGEVANAEF